MLPHAKLKCTVYFWKGRKLHLESRDCVAAQQLVSPSLAQRLLPWFSSPAAFWSRSSRWSQTLQCPVGLFLWTAVVGSRGDGASSLAVVRACAASPGHCVSGRRGWPLLSPFSIALCREGARSRLARPPSWLLAVPSLVLPCEHLNPSPSLRASRSVKDKGQKNGVMAVSRMWHR